MEMCNSESDSYDSGSSTPDTKSVEFLYLELELCEQNLNEFLEKLGDDTEPQKLKIQLLQIVKGISSGLDYLHRQGAWFFVPYYFADKINTTRATTLRPLLQHHLVCAMTLIILPG